MAPSTAFPVSLVSPDSAAAVSLNPSALGALAGWSLAYSHVAAASDTAYHHRTDAAWAASPIGAHLALGAGLDFLRPRGSDLPDSNGLLLAGALNLGASWSLGASWHLRSPRGGAPNLHTADLALSFRPSPVLGVSLIGRDLAAADVALAGERVLRAGLFAVLLRPLGDDRFGIELSGLVDQASDMGARMVAQAHVPWVGQLAASGELTQRDGREIWTLTGGIDLRWGTLSAAPALHTSREGEGPGWSLLAGVYQRPRPGLPTPGYVARVPLKGLGARGVLQTVMTLEKALHDPRIQGVILQPEDTDGGLAAAQEIRLLVAALQAAGKPVYCHLEATSGSEFYMCAGAERISLDPAGVIRLMGVSSESLYFGELFTRLGIRADFVRIGRYKSAPEQYTNREASPPAREQRDALLDDAHVRMVHDLAGDLNRPEPEVRALIDRGPFLPEEALASDLVAATVDAHDLEDQAKQLYGAEVRILDQKPPARHPASGPTGQIGVVVVDGAIVDGDNVDIPLLDIHMSGARTVVRALDRMAENPRIRAIVLRVDSPGGTVMASDQIWRAVRRARAEKPVLASMGSVAASGGYYVASAADEIWASPSTVTGSIGIFYGKVDFAPLAEKLGVGIETEKRGAHAGADSLFRPFTDEERATLTEKLRIWYRQFLARVAQGRGESLAHIDALARGRVYSGDAAQRLGLVDALGGFGSALARARALADLPPDAQVVLEPERPSGLLDYVLGADMLRAGQKGSVPSAFKPALGQILLLTRVSATAPLALFEGPVRVE